MRLRDGKKAGTLLLAALLLTGCGGAENTSDAVMSVSEDTAAGTWELVSMTYNGMTVGKEDLEEMGTCHDVWISWRTVPELWIMTAQSMI